MGLWPSVLSTAEVLELLVAPHDTIFGSYRRLLGDVAESLTGDDLSVALAWTRRQSHPDRVVPGAGVSEITERALVLAWDHVCDAAAVLRWLASHGL